MKRNSKLMTTPFVLFLASCGGDGAGGGLAETSDAIIGGTVRNPRARAICVNRGTDFREVFEIACARGSGGCTGTFTVDDPSMVSVVTNGYRVADGQNFHVTLEMRTGDPGTGRFRTVRLSAHHADTTSARTEAQPLLIINVIGHLGPNVCAEPEPEPAPPPPPPPGPPPIPGPLGGRGQYFELSNANRNPGCGEIYAGDFDGDGRADLAVEEVEGIVVYLNEGRRFVRRGVWTDTGPFGHRRYVADVNGDGKDDIFRLAGPGGGADVWISNGVGFDSYGSWTTAGIHGHRWYVGDFDGNGADDVFRVTSPAGGADVWLSNGTTFISYGSWNEAGFYGHRWEVGDFNGDGKDDILRPAERGAGADVWLSDGTTFYSAGAWNTAGFYGKGWQVGDFNGDGRDDLMRPANRSGAGVDVWLSDGERFFSAGLWSDAAPLCYDPWLVADFNGDGKDDIATSVPEGVYVHYSRGATFGDYLTAPQGPLGTPDEVIYAVAANGDLYWYRHIGGERWENGAGRLISHGWHDFEFVVSSSDGRIFAIRRNGELLDYRYLGNGEWEQPTGSVVARGWSRDRWSRVIGGWRGKIYGVEPDGDLYAFQYQGGGNWEDGGREELLGTGFDQCTELVAEALDTFYCLRADGTLVVKQRLRNRQWAPDRVAPFSMRPYRRLVSGGGGVLFGMESDGELWRIRDWSDGRWETPERVGYAWDQFSTLF